MCACIRQATTSPFLNYNFLKNVVICVQPKSAGGALVDSGEGELLVVSRDTDKGGTNLLSLTPTLELISMT